MNQESAHEIYETKRSIVGIYIYLWKISIISSLRAKNFFTGIPPLLSLSYDILHNPQMFLCLNGLNQRIENLDIIWKIWKLILWSEAGKNGLGVLMILNIMSSLQETQNRSFIVHRVKNEPGPNT